MTIKIGKYYISLNDGVVIRNGLYPSHTKILSICLFKINYVCYTQTFEKYWNKKGE